MLGSGDSGGVVVCDIVVGCAREVLIRRSRHLGGTRELNFDVSQGCLAVDPDVPADPVGGVLRQRVRHGWDPRVLDAVEVHLDRVRVGLFVLGLPLLETLLRGGPGTLTTWRRALARPAVAAYPRRGEPIAGDVRRVGGQRGGVDVRGAVELLRQLGLDGRTVLLQLAAAGFALHAVVVLGVVSVVQLEALLTSGGGGGAGGELVRGRRGRRFVVVGKVLRRLLVAVCRGHAAAAPAGEPLAVKVVRVDKDDVVFFLPPLLATPVHAEQHGGYEEETSGCESDADDAAFGEHGAVAAARA